MYDLSIIQNIFDINHKFLVVISFNYHPYAKEFRLDSSEIKLSNNSLELYSDLLVIRTTCNDDGWIKVKKFITDISIFDSSGKVKIWGCDYNNCRFKMNIIGHEGYLLDESVINGNFTENGIKKINKLLEIPKNRISALGCDDKSSYNNELKILSDKVDSLSNIVKMLMSQQG